MQPHKKVVLFLDYQEVQHKGLRLTASLSQSSITEISFSLIFSLTDFLFFQFLFFTNTSFQSVYDDYISHGELVNVHTISQLLNNKLCKNWHLQQNRIKVSMNFTLILAVYSPLPPNRPRPPSKISVSAQKRIASTEWAEQPQPPP